MTCNKCGKENPNGARFCEGCGGDMWKAPKKKGGILKVILIIILLAALCACGYWAKNTFMNDNEANNREENTDKSQVIEMSGEEKVIENIIEAINKNDADLMKKSFPEEIWSEKDFVKSIAQTRDILGKEYGEDFKLTYEIMKKASIEEENLEYYQEKEKEKYEKDFEFTGGSHLTVSVTVSGSEGNLTGDFDCWVFKIDEEWFVFDEIVFDEMVQI